MDEIKRESRQLKYTGTILKVYTDHMIMPDGRTADWDFIEHKGAAAVVPVTDDGKILMVRQYRNALERYTLEIPAGALNYVGEPKDVCAARELEEETGYKAGRLEWLMNLNTTVAFCNELIGIYIASDLTKTQQHLDDDEYINVEPHDLSELLDMVYAGRITDSKTVASLMAYKVKTERGA